MLRIGNAIQATHSDPVMLDQADMFMHYGILMGKTEEQRLGFLHWYTDNDEEWEEFRINANNEHVEKIANEEARLLVNRQAEDEGGWWFSSINLFAAIFGLVSVLAVAFIVATVNRHTK